MGEVVQITMGQSPDGSTYSDLPSKYVLVQGNADMKDGYVVPRIWTTQITKLADIGDLIMTVRAPVGAMGKTEYNVVIGRGVAAIKGNEFMYQLLKKMDKEGKWSYFSSGSTFDSINSEDIKNAEIIIPKLEEQNKLGESLNTLDCKITLHQRVLEEFNKIKIQILYLELTYTGKDRKLTKCLLKYAETWERRKLGEIFPIVESGNRLPKTMLEEGEVPYVVASNSNNGIVAYIRMDQKDYLGNSMKLFPANSITFSIDNPKAIFIQRNDFFTSNIMRVLHSGDITQFSLVFLSEQLRKLTNNYNWSFKFSGPVVMNSIISLPVYIGSSIDYSEIEMIGSFIDCIDNKITLHQRKLDKLKNLKSAYLAEMFPAEGERQPKRRFAGFTDDWERRKVSDEVISVDTGKSRFTFRENAKYEILGSTSVIGYDDSYDYEGNFLLTARVGANAGMLYRHSGKVKITDNTVFLQGNNLDFLFYQLSGYDLHKLSFGTGQPLVKASELKSLSLSMPKENAEKEQVAVFFVTLDSLITLHQRE